jgi:hypothetical protein
MEDNRITLSQATELDIRGKVYKIYPISISDFVSLEKSISKLESEKHISEVGKLVTDIAYQILKKSNDIKKEEVADVVTMEAFQYIVQAAMGTAKNVNIMGK